MSKQANPGKLLQEDDLKKKEAELEQAIAEYYRFDMEELKNKIVRMINMEVEKISDEKNSKELEINKRMNLIGSLS